MITKLRSFRYPRLAPIISLSDVILILYFLCSSHSVPIGNHILNERSPHWSLVVHLRRRRPCRRSRISTWWRWSPHHQIPETGSSDFNWAESSKSWPVCKSKTASQLSLGHPFRGTVWPEGRSNKASFCSPAVAGWTENYPPPAPLRATPMVPPSADRSFFAPKRFPWSGWIWMTNDAQFTLCSTVMLNSG
jgi:hypothetical protein